MTIRKDTTMNEPIEVDVTVTVQFRYSINPADYGVATFDEAVRMETRFLRGEEGQGDYLIQQMNFEESAVTNVKITEVATSTKGEE